MEELAVSSQIIKSVFFSQTDGRLYIRFHNGEERLFSNVPRQRATELVTATSPGRYYIENIKLQFQRLAA